MKSQAATPATEPDSAAIEPVKELRRLAHDLSNSLETIMQASYLLAQSKLEEGDRRWLEMIETATREAATTSRSMREILRAMSK